MYLKLQTRHKSSCCSFLSVQELLKRLNIYIRYIIFYESNKSCIVKNYVLLKNVLLLKFLINLRIYIASIIYRSLSLCKIALHKCSPNYGQLCDHTDRIKWNTLAYFTTSLLTKCLIHFSHWRDENYELDSWLATNTKH